MSHQAECRRFSLRFREFASIDTESGVIRDVAVITIGPALGHDLSVDSTTLAQVKSCAETYTNGLKVKMTHDGDAGDIVGRLTNFKIVDDRLLADLHLLKSSPLRGYILELAETIPDTFGLSIAFSGPVENTETARLARCTEIYSADLVSEPAANPTGLFDAGPLYKVGDDPAFPTKPNPQPAKFDMNPEDIQKIVDQACAAFSERLSKLEATITPPVAPDKKAVAGVPADAPAAEPDEPDAAELSAKLEAAAEKGASAALKLFAAQFGTAPAAPSAESKIQKPDTQPKSFEVLVREHADYSKNKAFAISDTIANHADAHASYLGRVRSGNEVILF